jgi:hypothetical protein
MQLWRIRLGINLQYKESTMKPVEITEVAPTCHTNLKLVETAEIAPTCHSNAKLVETTEVAPTCH